MAEWSFVFWMKAKAKAIYDAELRETKRYKRHFLYSCRSQITKHPIPHYPIIFSFLFFFSLSLLSPFLFLGTDPQLMENFVNLLN